MLKMTTQTTHTVDSDDLARFASELYGHQVELIASEEWSNYECHDFDVEIGPMDEDDAAELEDFKANGVQGMGITQLILQDLVNEKVIPAGNYIVKVFW